MKTTLLVAALATVAALPLAAQQESPGPPGSHAPLAPFAGRRIIVLPAEYLDEADSLGWAAQIPDVTAYLRDFDAEFEFALKDRGLSQSWVMTSRLPAEYKRSSDYMADPFHLAADWLRFPGPKKPVPYLPDPLLSQLRTILALNDKAEYVLLPIEIRFVKDSGSTTGRSVMRFAIIDPRRAKLYPPADVYSDPVEKFSPALLTSLAEHLADLFALPQH